MSPDNILVQIFFPYHLQDFACVSSIYNKYSAFYYFFKVQRRNTGGEPDCFPAFPSGIATGHGENSFSPYPVPSLIPCYHILFRTQVTIFLPQ